MGKNNNQIWIIRYIIGIILLSIMGVTSYFIAYEYAWKYYYNQLENLIVDRYLEGNEAIEVYSYSMRIRSDFQLLIRINKYNRIAEKYCSMPYAMH